jgi:hypothetical protein
MRKLIQVEDAKSLLEAAMDWGVWKWLTEKRKVRQTEVKSGWSDDLRKAYAELTTEAAVAEGGTPAKRKYEKAKKDAASVDPKIKVMAGKLKEAEDEAHRVRMEAERMFEVAEKHLSSSMAREASQVAIEAYNLREKVVRKAETGARAR